MVLLRKNIDSGGSGVSRKRFFFRLFAEAMKSALLGSPSVDFEDFGAPLGTHWAPNGLKKCTFLRCVFRMHVFFKSDRFVSTGCKFLKFVSPSTSQAHGTARFKNL